MRATERYERAWNAFQIHLSSICGVVDLPILGSNLVKIGVQGDWM